VDDKNTSPLTVMIPLFSGGMIENRKGQSTMKQKMSRNKQQEVSIAGGKIFTPGDYLRFVEYE
jgi:hypothetical protein